MNEPKGILFDFGGTLLSSKKIDAFSGNTRLLQFAVNADHLSAEDVQDEADKLEKAISTQKDSSLLEHSSRAFQKLLYDRLSVTFNISEAQMELEFWNVSVDYNPEPGIEKVLISLREKGLKLCVVSNTSFSSHVLKEDLHRHRLLLYFDDVIASSDYGIRKPHPFIFDVAIRRLGL